MNKTPLDLRQREFIGVILPDPNKKDNGNYITNLANSGVFGDDSKVSKDILDGANLLLSSISLGLSSVSGGSFLNFGGALTGITNGTPELKGLTMAFNAISNITDSFSSLNSYSMGYDSTILRNIGVLGDFAGKITSILSNSFITSIIQNMGLSTQDQAISNEISGKTNNSQGGISSDNSSYFDGFKGSDISSIKSLGKQIKNEPDGNIKNYVHIPELMYQVESIKGIWCFNRLSTVNRNSSSTSSGALGSMSKSIGDYVAGSISKKKSGDVYKKNNASDQGSGSSGKFVPLHPGTKVFIRFTENDFNTGNIVGLAHEEIDSQSELIPSNYDSSLKSKDTSDTSDNKATPALVSNTNNLNSNINNVGSNLSDLNKDMSMINSFSNSITSSSNLMSSVTYNDFDFKNFHASTKEHEDKVTALCGQYSNFKPEENK